MSDQPEAFATGFAPLQNTLKTLQLRHVHLWPRYVYHSENGCMSACITDLLMQDFRSL